MRERCYYRFVFTGLDALEHARVDVVGADAGGLDAVDLLLPELPPDGLVKAHRGKLGRAIIGEPVDPGRPCGGGDCHEMTVVRLDHRRKEGLAQPKVGPNVDLSVWESF
jgi:hypothetical protein